MLEPQFDFSGISYEYVDHESSMPFKTFFISVGYRGAHWHREFEIILLLDGELNIQQGNNITQLRTGDLYLINPYEMHGFITGRKINLLLVIQIDPIISSACPKNLYNYSFDLTPKSSVNSDVRKEIKKLMASVILEVISRKEGYEYACMGAVNSLISLLIRKVSHDQKTTEELKAKLEWVERLSVLLEYINRHHNKDLSLQELANQVNLSPFYVSHIIKRNTGFSFRENLSIIRTHHATSLMLMTDKKLTDIAFEAGFSDIKYFNRSFKKLHGETPSQIRKKANWKEIIKKEFWKDNKEYENLIPLLKNFK